MENNSAEAVAERLLPCGRSCGKPKGFAVPDRFNTCISICRFWPAVAAALRQRDERIGELGRQIIDYERIIQEDAASVFGQENKRLNERIEELERQLSAPPTARAVLREEGLRREIFDYQQRIEKLERVAIATAMDFERENIFSIGVTKRIGEALATKGRERIPR